MNIQVFDSGIVGDPDEGTQGNDLNLITQDMKAMRAVKRMNAKVRFPAAFSVAKQLQQYPKVGGNKIDLKLLCNAGSFVLYNIL